MKANLQVRPPDRNVHSNQNRASALLKGVAILNKHSTEYIQSILAKFKVEFFSLLLPTHFHLACHIAESLPPTNVP